MSTSQERPFAILRIIFGGVWLIDASFKWTPAFLHNFTGYLTGALQDQPAAVQIWIKLWIQLVSVNPSLFAIIVAFAETAIGLGLLFGIFTRPALIGGALLSLVIWTTAEGFGGPYIPGSTDIGTGIIYVLVFVALWFGNCWRQYSVDSHFRRKSS